MSKSKKNVVDPDDIIASYGADTARWFMLSDSPPDRDVIWTEAGVEGAHRFVQRLWRLVSEAAPSLAGSRRAERASEGEAGAVSKAAHKTLKLVGEDIGKLAFNKAVARIYELANTLQAPLASLSSGKAAPELAPAPRIVGTVQIDLATLLNQRHRAEVVKLLAGASRRAPAGRRAPPDDRARGSRAIGRAHAAHPRHMDRRPRGAALSIAGLHGGRRHPALRARIHYARTRADYHM